MGRDDSPTVAEELNGRRSVPPESQKKKNVVQVQEYVAIDDVTEDEVDQGLKDRGCVCESKRHHAVLIVASGGVEHRFPVISLPYADQMLGIPQIQLSEILGLLEGCEGRGDEWNRVTVLNRDLIEAPIINTGAKRAVLLPHKEETGTCW